MTVHIPGFPALVGPPLDLPDIGELLMSPQFQCISADDYRRHATEFQRYLLDKIPLKNDKAYVLVRSGVALLEPGLRTHTKRTGDWHIDGAGPFDHHRPSERVHILSSPCKALTEFNLNPLEIEADPSETRDQLSYRIRQNPTLFGVIGRAIEPARIYTFENHLHRAVDPPRIEFRYFLRVRETAEMPSTTAPLVNISIASVEGITSIHIKYCDHGVWIARPHTLRG